MEKKVIVHLNPVWRDRANFIIGAWCSNKEGDTLIWEQLWSRQIAEDRFEICCIPFFVRNLALGDEVETATENDQSYVVQRVINPSGHFTFRVWFGDSPNSVAREEVVKELLRHNCLMEWYSQNLLGVDATTSNHAQAVADYLYQKEQESLLIYETGRT
jgi:hypothetical protein